MYGRETKDPEYPDERGDRLDGRNLIAEWIKNKTVKINGFLSCFLIQKLIKINIYSIS